MAFNPLNDLNEVYQLYPFALPSTVWGDVIRINNYRVKQATYEQTQTQSLYQYKITTRWRPLTHNS